MTEVHVTAPGRVNLLGEHVDYNGGAVLPAAIDRKVVLTARPQTGRVASIRAVDLADEVLIPLDSLDLKTDVYGKPLPNWALYPAGVAWALQENGYATAGFKGSFTSDIPIGAGLSSSAAVEVAFAGLWDALGNLAVDRVRLAQICQQAENQYVGINSGLMDQFASANGVAGHVLHLNTQSLAWEVVPLPEDTVLIIADSSIRRSLFSSAYNERRRACDQAVDVLQHYLPETHQLCDISPGAFDALEDELPAVIQKRARHVVYECERVREAVELLKAGDADAFGRLMFAGHTSLRDLYEVSIPELDLLVELAAELPGCLGARLTGAGFGGCTVNLVRADFSDAFITGLQEEFQQRSGKNASVYLCHASDGLRVTNR